MRLIHGKPIAPERPGKVARVLRLPGAIVLAAGYFVSRLPRAGGLIR